MKKKNLNLIFLASCNDQVTKNDKRLLCSAAFVCGIFVEFETQRLCETYLRAL